MEKSYTIKEAAKKMKIGYHTLRNLVLKQKISYTLVGSRKKITDEDIAKFYEKNKIEAI